MKKGLLIVLEGIDGAGKSTQAKGLIRRLRYRGFDAVSFREPTRGRYGREIRNKARTDGSLTPKQELNLFLLDRRENVTKNIRPALSAGRIVVMDRYYFSTIAYQGAKGLDLEFLRRANERFAPRPDLVFILDLPAAQGLDRIGGRKTRDLLFERDGYLRRVRRIFRGLQGRRFVHLDAGCGRRELGDEILARVLTLRGPVVLKSRRED
ncbi:MAG: dTMP kinase [Candidatus Aminicenantes bacterium]|nr:dTMP kinase [Candidatus Aminicenantes bacterium]